MDETSLRFWLEGLDGQEREFEVIGTFEMDGTAYMALSAVAGQRPGTQTEVFLTGFHGDEEDRIVFDDITDEDEYGKAAKAFEDIFNGRVDTEEFVLTDGTGQKEEERKGEADE